MINKLTVIHETPYQLKIEQCNGLRNLIFPSQINPVIVEQYQDLFVIRKVWLIRYDGEYQMIDVTERLDKDGFRTNVDVVVTHEISALANKVILL